MSAQTVYQAGVTATSSGISSHTPTQPPVKRADYEHPHSLQPDDSCDTSSGQAYQRLVTSLASLVPKGAVVAFSGGVDSALVAAALYDTYQQVCAVHESVPAPQAVTFSHPFTPQAEVDHARKVAEQIGIEHRVLTHSHVDDCLLTNPTNRCYLCKQILFSNLARTAQELGYAYLLDGTNADDAHGYRPGLQALEELGVISVLQRAGLSKEEVRACARYRGLSVADRPSMPCMATRFPYDTLLNLDLFTPLYEAEQELMEAGIAPVRLRVHNDLLRIEVGCAHMEWAVSHAEQLCALGARLGCVHTCLDLMPHASGSMDIARGLLDRKRCSA